MDFTCPECGKGLQFVNPVPSVGDRFVCSSLACDYETTVPTDALLNDEPFDDCDNFQEYPREVDFGPEDSFADITSWDDLSPF